MASTALRRFRTRALAKRGVKEAYETLDEEFAFLDEVLKARAEAGLTQAEKRAAPRRRSAKPTVRRVA